MRRRPLLCTAPREKLPSSVFAPLRGDVFREDNPGGRNLKKSSLVWKARFFPPFSVAELRQSHLAWALISHRSVLGVAGVWVRLRPTFIM